MPQYNFFTAPNAMLGQITSTAGGLFADDDAAARYAARNGYYTFEVVSEQPVVGDTIAPLAAPGLAVDFLTDPVDGIPNLPTYDDLPTPAPANPGYVRVSDSIKLYDVTRTVEVTVQVYGTDKSDAIRAIAGQPTAALIEPGSTNVREYATTARLHEDTRNGS